MNIIELQMQYPHLKFSRWEGYPNGVIVQLPGSGQMYHKDIDGLDNYYHQKLKNYDEEARVKAMFEEQYPFVYFSIKHDFPFTPQMIWVKRDGRDSEAISVSKNFWTDKEFMTRINEQAKLAQQENWFFCSTCNKAYPPEQYGYFYFAGNYCKDCKEKNPGHYAQAQAETYN